jgi:hypothetical protein
MKKRQLAYLHSLGLPQGASQIQIDAFVATLGAGQAGFLQELAAWTDTPEGREAGRSEDRPAGATAGSAPANPAATAVPAASGTSATSAPGITALPAAPASPNIEELVQAATRAERNRVAHAQTVARQLALGEQWAQAQIDGNFTAEQINAAAVQQTAANRAPVALGAPRVEIGVDRHGLAVGAALVDAMLARAGTPLLEIDAATAMPVPGRARAAHTLAGRFRGNAIMLAQTYLQMCGRDTSGMSAPQLAQAVFINCPRVPVAVAGVSMTSSDFPLLLANAAGVSMQTRYALAPKQWPVFAIESPASDFRQQTLVKLGSLPILPEVKEGGEYTYVNFGEDAEVWTLVKRGYILGLSWEMIVNDQVGAFNQVIAMEGDAAARTDDTLAFAVVTANATMRDGGALLNATAVTTAGGHANYVAHGSGAAPSVITLSAARAAMAAQSAPPKNLADTRVPLNVRVGVILVPVALEGTARVLNRAQYDPAAVAGTLTPNIWQGAFGPPGEGERIASHALLDAADPVAWYVCTNPAVQPAMILGYLDGYRGPQLTQESGFDTDTRKFKVSHARVAKATDWRFWYGNNGN